MRQQNTLQNSDQPATSMRKPSGSQRAQSRGPVTTEYQERFLPPNFVDTTQKNQSDGVNTFRSFYVSHKWIRHPPKAVQPSSSPKVHQRCASAPHNTVRFAESQLPSEVEDYTSVYQNDFQAWKADRRQPYKLVDNLKVKQGLVATNSSSKEGRSQKNSVQVAADSKPVPEVQEEPTPFESLTSYRHDYVTHPVQPVTRRKKLTLPAKGLLPSEPAAASWEPKVAWDVNQDEVSEFFMQVETLSLQGKAKECSPAADHSDHQTTARAPQAAHKCPRTKLVLPSMQNTEKTKKRFPTKASADAKRYLG